MTSNDHAQQVFNILVLATVSAGKSTLINTLFGCDLLPIANEPTTAKIFCVKNCTENIKPICRAISFNDKQSFQADWKDATSSIIQEYNESPDIDYIEIQAKAFSESISKHNFYIYDTPGPNTYEFREHESYTKLILESVIFDQLLCLIDATNTSTLDELDLLESYILPYILKNKNTEIIFLLNKVDRFDEEQDGTVQNLVEKTKLRLERIGFSNPQIMPIMAHYAFILRRLQAGSYLTRKERRDAESLQKRLPKYHNSLLKQANLNEKTKKELLLNLKYTRHETHASHYNLGSAFRLAFRKKVDTFIQETCVTALERYIDMRASHVENSKTEGIQNA